MRAALLLHLSRARRLRLLALALALALALLPDVAPRGPARPSSGLLAAARFGVGGGAAGPLSSSSSSSSPDFCARRDLYPNCWRWKHDPAVRRLLPHIVLVGNELFQQLPTIGYGGIETSVDTMAGALVRMGIPFHAIVPARRDSVEMPFTVLETAVGPNGRGGFVPEYVREVNLLLEEGRNASRETEEPHVRGERVGQGRTLYTDGGTKTVAFDQTLVVWGQSEWSQAFAVNADAMITSHHDGGGPPTPHWNRRLKNVRHRFLSHDQRGRWTTPGHEAFNISRVIPHGLNPDAFRLCEDKGYLLWVAGFNWGWEGKGLDIFIEMAKARPQYKFVAHGSGNDGIAGRLRDLEKELKNFEFRGPLLRGENHTKAFCEASAFVMPTHESIGESFGLTVIESLSKGVPVIASMNGAVPEILAIPGPERNGVSPYGTTCGRGDLSTVVPCYVAAADRYRGRTRAQAEAIQSDTRMRFDEHTVVDAMLGLSLDTLVGVGRLPVGAGGVVVAAATAAAAAGGAAAAPARGA
jgi:glycosyltransferase involved in cell wall biosynthesis